MGTTRLRAVRVVRDGRFYGRFTRVILADGYQATFVGALGKAEAVRQALALRAREAVRS